MESRPVVKPLFGKFDEVVYMIGCHVRKELQSNVSEFCMDDGSLFRHLLDLLRREFFVSHFLCKRLTSLSPYQMDG